ncbi:MAG: response regulator [Nitrospinota bacterium]|nr:response regulator [Nitrospinota bacterium]
MSKNNRVTASDILNVVPITRKTLWLWQKNYKFFPDPVKEAHPGGKGIVGYYPAWVEERCKKVYALQKKGCTIGMIKDILQKEKEQKSGRKILIVDDEKKFCMLLKKFFQDNDFVAEVAMDGFEAGFKAREFLPTIILLDITLPGINGIEVCRSLKNNEDTTAIKVIAMSGDLRYTEGEVVNSGAEMFLPKPIEFESLLKICNDMVASDESA